MLNEQDLLEELKLHGDVVEIPYLEMAKIFPSVDSHPHEPYWLEGHKLIDTGRMFAWGAANGWEITSIPEKANPDIPFSFPIKLTKVSA